MFSMISHKLEAVFLQGITKLTKVSKSYNIWLLIVNGCVSINLI